MIDEKKQQTAPLQQLSVFASKADQTIEEWIQHFIKQIEQESAKPASVLSEQKKDSWRDFCLDSTEIRKKKISK